MQSITCSRCLQELLSTSSTTNSRPLQDSKLFEATGPGKSDTKIPRMALTPEITERILSRISGGESLRSILSGDDMPDRSTFFRQLQVDEALRDQYARACAVRVEHYVEEIIEIADDKGEDWTTDEKGNSKPDASAVQRSRLQVDARKWIASKLAPKKYGEKLDLNHSGDITVEFK